MDKEIKFIDSSYNELFTVPDGGEIFIIDKNGDSIKAKCEYVDESHTKIDGKRYNMLSWARLMDRNEKISSPIDNLETSVNWFTNKLFVKKNYDVVNQDKFFKTDYGFEEIYYNPDSTAGGQLVYNEFTFELIREASKQDSMMKFYNYLNSGCKQYCVDIDSAEFMNCVKDFIDSKPDYLKDNKETANAMIKAANEDKKRNKTEPER